MNIDIKHENGILLLQPQEKSLEGANSKVFKSKVMELIEQGNKMIVLNISKIEFMDSSGLGCLISILKSLTTIKGKIVLCEAQPPVIRIFNLTRLTLIFEIFTHEKDALNSLGILTSLKNNE